jgi:hypothetical protein
MTDKETHGGALAGSVARRRLVRIFMVGMLCLHLLLFLKLWNRVERGYSDFTAFYAAGKTLHEGLGTSLYDLHTQQQVQRQFAGDISSRHGPLPYIHPPFEALVFLPLTLLPYTQAFVAWNLLNLIALLGVALLLRPHLNALSTIPVWEFLLGFLALFPTFLNLLQGQDSILLLLLFTLAFVALKQRANFVCGCWLALGTFKFQFAIPLVLLIVIWSRKRVAAGFASVLLLLVLLSARVVGWNELLQYPRFILHIARAPDLGDVPPALMPNLRGLLEGWSISLRGFVPEVLTMLGSAMLLLWAATKRNTLSGPHINAGFSLAILVSVLVGWHTNVHDLVLLILPLMLVLDSCLSLPLSTRTKWRVLLPALPLLFSPFWMLLWFGSGRVNLMAITLLWLTWETSKTLSTTDLEKVGAAIK